MAVLDNIHGVMQALGAGAGTMGTALGLGASPLQVLLFGTAGTAVGMVTALKGKAQGAQIEAINKAVSRMERQDDADGATLRTLLDAHGIDPKKLPEQADDNPLALFALLLTGQTDAIRTELGESTKLTFSLLRSIEQHSVSIRQQTAFAATDLAFVREDTQAIRDSLSLLKADIHAAIADLRPRPRLMLPQPGWDPVERIGNPFLFTDQRVPMFGREYELSQLRKFMRNEKKVSWWLLTGEAGLGKSRLAYEICLEARLQGWDAGFLSKASDFTDWNGWTPNQPSLVVIDYVGERPEAAAKAITEMYCRGDGLPCDIRFLLLERHDTGQWKEKLMRGEGSSGRTAIPRAEFQSAIALRPLKDASLAATLAHILNEHEKEDVDPELHLRILKKLDPDPGAFGAQADGFTWNPRPLYAAIVADAIADKGAEIVGQWDGDHLLDHVLQGERDRWNSLKTGMPVQQMDETHVNALSAGTIAGALHLDEAKRALNDGPAAPNRLLPGTETEDRYFLDHLGRFAGLEQGDPDEDKCSFMPSLKPDILGERFVLDRLAGSLSLHDGYAQDSCDATRALICKCWKWRPKAVAEFMVRAVSDFPNHTAMEKLWTRCEDADPGGGLWATVAGELVPVLLSRGKADLAFETLDELLRLNQASPDNTDIAGGTSNALNAIGRGLHDAAQFDQALGILRDAERVDRAAFGDDHPNVAIRVNNIGTVLEDKGELDEALTCFRDAERIDRAAFGDDHPEVATDVNNIGSVLTAIGEHDEALKCFRDAERIDRAAFSDDHPSVAVGLNNIGAVLEEKGEHDEALKCYRDAERIDRAAFGDDHPKVAIRVNNIGSVLMAKGELDEALECCRDAERIDRAAFGDDHPNVAVGLNNIGSVLHAKDDEAGARRCYETAFGILLRAVGPRGQNVVVGAFNVASVGGDPIAIARKIAGDEVAKELAEAMKQRFEQMRKQAGEAEGEEER